MKLEIVREDPLGILQDTKWVVEQAQSVQLHIDAIESISEVVRNKLQKGLEGPKESFGTTTELEKNALLVFWEDVVNFSFWDDREPSWKIKVDGKEIGGWYGLVACFERALEKDPDVLTAEYMSAVSKKTIEEMFTGENGVAIPMVEARRQNLQEAGTLLKKKYGGSVLNLLETVDYDAIDLAEKMFDEFGSFRDVSEYKGKPVRIMKRPQILASDLNMVLLKPLKRVDQLTAFADYRLPQLLRHFEVLGYSPLLRNQVDNKMEIEHDTEEEIEIRAATIWAVELIRQKLNVISANEVDYALWLLARDYFDVMKPHHRTRTIFY